MKKIKSFFEFLNESRIKMKPGDSIDVLNDKYNIDNGPWEANIVKHIKGNIYLTSYDEDEYEFKPKHLKCIEKGKYTYG